MWEVRDYFFISKKFYDWCFSYGWLVKWLEKKENILKEILKSFKRKIFKKKILKEKYF